MLKMLSDHVLQHHDTMSTLLPSKMATNTMVSRHAVDHVLISSGAPPCEYSTLVSNGF